MNTKVENPPAYTGHIYEPDDRKLFCKHCGRATWLHSYIPHVGYACRSDALLAQREMKP